jgi:uncharacterized protein (DUF1697 family)
VSHNGGVRWVAFVRNVMVGREGLDRERLLDVARRAGGEDVRSHITTGNLTFTAADAPDSLARQLEDGVSAIIGRREMVAVRPLEWVRELVATKPFEGLDAGAWSTEVALLRHDAPALELSALGDAERTVVVRVLDREVLAARPRDGGRRPHPNTLAERASGRPATSRAWSTLERVAARG